MMAVLEGRRGEWQLGRSHTQSRFHPVAVGRSHTQSLAPPCGCGTVSYPVPGSTLWPWDGLIPSPGSTLWPWDGLIPSPRFHPVAVG